MTYRPLLLLLTLLFCSPSTAQLTPLQLANTYQGNVDVSEYLISEKLDGIRARWTGKQLLTRNGNEISAPKWFTQGWPNQPMDGELWSARGSFEYIASVVLSSQPDNRWRNITMMVFDIPVASTTFEQRVVRMKELVAKANNPALKMIEQFSLPSQQALENKLDALTRSGAEGLMLHHKQALYQAGRNPGLLKAKRYQDDEAKVIAHLPGQGKFSNVMGSLLVESKAGQQFKIGSGFSLAERQSPPPIGSWITFKYYGLTRKGIPRFASFLHRRPPQVRPK